MNIILIGFMGSGKSSVARILAKKLKKRLIEMDDYVLKKSKHTTINEIFDKDGETKFRELEIEAARDLSKEKNCVISTGGGVVMNKIILDWLKEDGIIIYLRAGFNEVKKRLEGSSDRPLFRNPKHARALFNFRTRLYRTYSNDSVRTDGKTIGEVADEVIDIYNSYK